MFAAYVTVTALAAFAVACAAALDFVHHSSVVAVTRRLRMSEAWMLPLGCVLAAGAAGLLAGFAVPWIGTAAAVGLVLYFIGAMGAHARVRDRHVGGAVLYFALVAAALAVALGQHGPG